VSGPDQLPLAEVFLNARFTETRLLDIASWQVAAFSHASPDRGPGTPSEDACACFQLSDGTGVLMVADGVGGHSSGEVASALAIQAMHQRLSEHPAGSPLRGTILDALEAANQSILGLANGAATTVAMVELHPDYIRPYHIGDSIITLFSQRGRLKWQSIGHAPLGYAVEAGVLDEEEAMVHPERHLVSNVVGQDDMSISLGPRLPMAARDTLVICSDGLSDNVSTKEIIELLRTGPLQSGCDDVVTLAHQRMQLADDMPESQGKPDDLTFLACRPLGTSTADRE